GPTDPLLHRLRIGGKLCALGLRQRAGVARAARLLKRLDGGCCALAWLAIDEAVVVPGKGEIELDADTLLERQIGDAAFLRAALLGRGFPLLCRLGDLDGLRG